MEYYIELGSSGQAVGFPVLSQNLGYIFPEEEITPENMLRHGYHIIIDSPPEINDSQRLDKNGFSQKEDGSISFDYTVVDLTRHEALDRLIRYRRAQLLTWCDWTQATDSPLTAEKKAEWAAYRQALRDLTTTYADAVNESDIVWPTNPNAIAIVTPAP
jgi:hypothetical protein